MLAFETRDLNLYLNEIHDLLLEYGAPTDRLLEIKEIISPFNVPIAVSNLLLALEQESTDLLLKYGPLFRRAVIVITKRRVNNSPVLPEAAMSENIAVMVETAEKMVTQDLDTLLEKNWFSDLAKNVRLYEGTLYPDNYKKMYCAWPLRNCSECNYDYKSGRSGDLPYCPKCGYLRTLCSNTASPDGRCAMHSRGAAKQALVEIVEERKITSRTQLYANAVQDYRLAEAFQELSQLPDTLSTVPEIKLIGARVVQLIQEMSGLDVDAMHKRLLLSVREIERIRQKAIFTTEDFLEVGQVIQDMLNQTSILLDDRTAWREISSLTDQLSRMIENERKAQSRDKAVITLEESIRLQKGFGRAVFSGIAEVVPDLVQKLTIETVDRLVDATDFSEGVVTELKAAAYNIAVDKTTDTRWIVELLLNEVKRQSEKQRQEMKQLL